MESIAEKLLVLVPGAFVVIITLVICLRHNTQQNERWIASHEETSKKSNDATDKCSTVVEKNTEMLGRISGILTRIENGGSGGN
jgi:hypothetical protein